RDGVVLGLRVDRRVDLLAGRVACAVLECRHSSLLPLSREVLRVLVNSLCGAAPALLARGARARGGGARVRGAAGGLALGDALEGALEVVRVARALERVLV